MSNKFKVGDRIKTPASDRVGYCYASVTSVDTEVTPYHTESVYTVVWEHHNYSSHQYKASEVDSLWKLADICLAVDMTIKLPRSINFIPITLDIEGIKVCECDHKWVNYRGLIENYQFCSKCDEKRPT